MADLKGLLKDLLLEIEASQALDRYLFHHHAWLDTADPIGDAQERAIMSVMRRPEYDPHQNNRITLYRWLGEDDDDPGPIAGDEDDIE